MKRFAFLILLVLRFFSNAFATVSNVVQHSSNIPYVRLWVEGLNREFEAFDKSGRWYVWTDIPSYTVGYENDVSGENYYYRSGSGLKGSHGSGFHTWSASMDVLCYTILTTFSSSVNVASDSRVSVPYISSSYAECSPSYIVDTHYVTAGSKISCCFPDDVSDTDGTPGCGYSYCSVTVDGELVYERGIFKSGGTHPDPAYNYYSNHIGNRYYCNVDGFDYEIVIPSEGNHVVELTAIDNLGNSCVKTYGVYVDSISPELRLLNPEVTEVWMKKDVTLRAAASDSGSGVREDSWCWSKDGGRNYGRTSTAASTATFTEDGRYSVIFSASDFAGNRGYTSAANVLIDRAAPDIGLSGSADGVWQNFNFVTASASDSVSYVNDESWTCSLDDGPYESGKTARNLSDGKHVVSFKVSDFAGNSGSAVFNIYSDITLPVIEDFTRLTKINEVRPVIYDLTSGIVDSLVFWRLDGGEAHHGFEGFVPEGIHRLEFSASDRAGNCRVLNCEVIVDTEPPIVNFEIPEYTNKRELDVIGFEAYDLISKKVDVWYAFDEREYADFSDGTEWKNSVNAFMLPEGMHRFFIKADDNHFNDITHERSFIMDRSCPVLYGVKISSGDEGNLEDGDLICVEGEEGAEVHKIHVEMDGIDFCGDTQYGKIKCWQMSFNNGAYIDFESNCFEWTDFVEGRNELKFRLEDMAGNVSNEVSCFLIKDSSVPLAPVMTSSTHPRAFSMKDTVRSGEARFYIRSVALDDNGIKGFVQGLYKCSSTFGGIPDLSVMRPVEGHEEKFYRAGLEENVEFHFLEDNEQNEFYCFRARVVSKNSIKSGYSDFVFRVDSKAPDEFDMWITPQIDPNAWYNNPNVCIQWNKGKDRSEIAKLIYTTGGDYWNTVSDPDSRIKWIKIDGCADLAMRSVDIAGNYAEKGTSLKIDTSCPYFDDFILEPSWKGKKLKKQSPDKSTSDTVLVTWGDFYDDESGPDLYELELQCLDDDSYTGGSSGSRKFYYDLAKKSCSVGKVNDNYSYLVKLSGLDKAGNRVTKTRLLLSKYHEMNESILFDYSYSHNGIDISGKATIDPKTEVISFVSDPELRWSLSNAYKIKSASVVFDGSSIAFAESHDVQGSDIDSLSAGGIDFRFRSIQFDSEYGLILNHASFLQEKDINVEFPFVTIGFPSNFLPYGISSSFESGTIKSDWFDYEKCERIELKGDEKLIGSKVEIQSLHGILQDEKDDLIGISDGAMNFKNSASYGAIDAGCKIRLEKGPLLEIKKGWFYGEIIYIEESSFDFVDHDESYHCKVKSFSYDDRTGEFLTEKIAFDFTDKEGNAVDWFYSGGVNISSDDFKLSKDGIFSCAGTVETNVMALQINGIGLSEEGFEFGSTEVSSFNTSILGYDVSVLDAKFIPDGLDGRLEIISGKVKLFHSEYGISGLSINAFNHDEIFRECFMDDFSVNPGYGTAVSFSSVVFSRKGIICDCLVPLPQSKEALSFSDAKILPDDSLACFINEDVGFCAWNTDFYCNGILFDGSKISCAGYVDSSRIQLYDLDGEAHRERLCFKGLSFGFTAVYSDGYWDYEGLVYRHGAFDCHVNYLSLGIDGINLQVDLNQFVHDEGIDVHVSATFENLLVYGNGSISCRSSNENATVAFLGRNYSFEEPYLAFENGNAVLKSVRASTVLFDCNGFKSIVCGETTVDSKGHIKGDEFEQNLMFTSTNGIRVKIFEAVVRQEGLCVSGSFFIDGVKGTGYSVNHALNILYDGTIVSLESIRNFDLELFNFQVKGFNLDVGENSFILENVSVPWRNTFIDYGKIVFDGNFIPSGIFEQEKNEKIDFVLANSTIVSTCCDWTGFHVGCLVSFPSYMGNGNVLCDRIRITPDGDGEFDGGVSSIISFNDHGEDFFEFHDMIFSSDSIFAGKLKIHHDSVVGPLDLTLYSVHVGFDGRIAADNIKSESFVLDGNIFCMESLSCGPEGISFSGYGQLNDKMPGMLAGKLFTVSNMSMGWDGTITDVDAYTSVYSEIPMGNDWSFYCTRGRFRNGSGHLLMDFEDTVLRFPPQYIVSAVPLNGVAYNIGTGEFDFDALDSNVSGSLSLGGISYTINRLHMGKDFVAEFYGIAEFSGSGFPEILHGRTTDDVEICILPDGTLDHLVTRITGLNGNIEEGLSSVLLKDGSMEVLYDGTDCIGKITGNMGISEGCDMDLSSLDIPILTFEYDLIHHDILNLVAKNDASREKFKNVEFDDLVVNINWTKGSEKVIALSGDMILPAYLPDGLSLSSIPMETFLIGRSGDVLDFSAVKSFSGAFSYCNGLLVFEPQLKVYFNNDSPVVSLSGSIVLEKEKFPDGIGGIESECFMEFNNIGLISFESSGNIPDGLIFGNIYGENLSFEFKVHDYEGSVNFAGDLSFPGISVLPDSLAGVKVHFDEFSFYFDGRLKNLDAMIRVLDFSLFNAVEISDVTVCFLPGKLRNEILLSVSAGAKVISPYVPQGLRDSTVVLDRLTFSTISGLDEFNVFVDGGFDFTVMGGLDVYCNSLSLSAEGFYCSALAYLDFSGPMKNTCINLNAFKMDWGGNIIEINGGLDYTQIDIAGFSGSINRLYFVKDGSCQDGFCIHLDECMIQLPENMGLRYVALKNARFMNGSFSGELSVSNIDMWICGFRLVFSDPYINFEGREIGFSYANVEFPRYLSFGSAQVYNARISSEHGLCLDGVSFSIPSLSIGGRGFCFRDLNCVFIKSGSTFVVSGSGKANIPNTCEIAAEVSFTNVSSVYPIGLMRGYFGFEINPPHSGIPLGASGLYITGARGGLAFGPPYEVPEKIRGFYNQDNGMRIQIGISISDKTGGSIVSMTPDTWVDIQNITWGMYGGINILRSTFNFNGDAYAMLNPYGFYTGMNIDFYFIDGNIQASVSNISGSTKISGDASARIRIEKGSIKTFTIGVWKFKKKIYIPPFSMTTARLGTQFGHFTNGSVGFKASVSMLGFDFGVFVSNTGVGIGNVSSYSIYNPAADLGFDLDYIPVSPDSNGFLGPYAMNYRNEGSFTSEIFIDQNIGEFSILCAYEEGDPWIKLKSTDGIVFSPEEGNMTVLQMDGSRLFMLKNPESGKYDLEIENADRENLFVSSLSTPRIPTIDIHSVENEGEELAVYGKSDVTGQRLLFRLVDVDNPGIFIELGEDIVSSDGTFFNSMSLLNVYNGKYYLEIRSDLGNDFSSEPVRWHKEIVVVHDVTKFNNPINLLVFEDEDLNPELIWTDLNGAIASSHLIKIVDIERNETCYVNPGYLTRYKFIEGTKGRHLQYSICSCDSDGTPFMWSEPVEYFCGESRKDVNMPFCKTKNISVNCVAGKSSDFVIDAIVKNTSDDVQYAYFTASQISDNEDRIYCTFDDENEIDAEEIEVHGRLFVPIDCPPGSYFVETKVYNKGNVHSFDIVEIEAVVTREELCISNVYPVEIDGTKDNVVHIAGSGFSHGTRYYLEDEELAVKDYDLHSSNMVSLEVPKQESCGERNIRAVSSDGIESSIALEVGLPSYHVSCYLSSVKCNIGAKVFVPVWIDRRYGYDKPVSIELARDIKGIELDIPSFVSESGCMISVSVLNECSQGLKTIELVCDNGLEFSFDVIVSGEMKEIKPEIEAVVPETACVGDVVSVYGSGFSSDCKLFLNGECIEPISSVENIFTFIVRPEMKSGNLYVRKDELVSNLKRIYIREHFLYVEPSVARLTVSSDAEYRIPLSTKCSSGESVYYQCIFDGDNIEASIAENVEFPGQKYVLVKTGKIIPEKEYSLLIRAYSGTYYADSIIDVYTASERFIDFSDIYTGRTGIDYCAQLNMVGFGEEYVVNCHKENLPLGLNIDSKGRMYGIPQAAGEYFINVEVSDGDEITHGTFRMRIIENELSMKGSDPGLSDGYSFLKGNEILERHPFLEEYGMWLYSNERIYAAKDNAISCLDENDKLIWKYSCETSISKLQLSGNGIFLLLSSGKLIILDRENNLIREIESVMNFHGCDDYVLICTNEKILKINSQSLTLMHVNKDEYEYVMQDSFFLGKKLYSWNDKFVRTSVFNNRKFLSDSPIISCMSSGGVIVCLCEKGIRVLDENLELMGERDIDLSRIKSWAFVNGKIYFRKEGELMFFEESISEMNLRK